MEIVQLKPSELVMYEGNCKAHPESQIKVIAESIKEFGFNVPIIIDCDNNTIVAGHGRLLAARMLGLETVPCMRLTNLTEEQIQAYRLVDNAVSMAGWDMNKLQDEINSLFEFDAKNFGFGFDEIAAELEEGFNTTEASRQANPPADGPAHGGRETIYTPQQCTCPGCGHKFIPNIDEVVSMTNVDPDDELTKAFQEE